MMRYFIFLTVPMLLSIAIFAGCNESSEPTAGSENPATVEATPVVFANSECPIMGGEPTEDLTAEYQGKTIGFCCDGCPQKWAALSEEEKANKFAEVKKTSASDKHGSHQEHGHDHADHQHGDHEHADHEHAEHSDQ